MCHALALERRRLGDERLRWRIPLARHFAFLDRPPFDRPHRPAVGAIEHIEPALLGRLADRLDGLTVDDEIHEDWRARNVVIPDAVVHELVMPLALTGLDIEREQRLGEQIDVGALELRRRAAMAA